MPPKGVIKPPTVPTAQAEGSAAAQQQQANSAGISEFELPKTTLTKLAKGSIPDNVKMQQDVVLALLRSSTMFINYLTAAAHDQAHARSGKSITASDVLKAISELDFGPADALIPLLEHELTAYRNHVQTNKAKPRASLAKPKGRKSGVSVVDSNSVMDEDDSVRD